MSIVFPQKSTLCLRFWLGRFQRFPSQEQSNHWCFPNRSFLETAHQATHLAVDHVFSQPTTIQTYLVHSGAMFQQTKTFVSNHSSKFEVFCIFLPLNHGFFMTMSQLPTLLPLSSPRVRCPNRVPPRSGPGSRPGTASRSAPKGLPQGATAGAQVAGTHLAAVHLLAPQVNPWWKSTVKWW